MILFQNDSAYARSRLQGSYLYDKTRKKMVYVRDIGGGREGLTAHVADRNGKEEMRALDSLEFRFPPLGFINVAGDRSTRAIFLFRFPIRNDWRQGIRARQLGYYSLSSDHIRRFGKDYAGCSEAVLTWSWPSIEEELFKGSYPSIQKALKLVEDSGAPIAISPNYAINDQFQLCHRQRVVGEITPQDLLSLNKNKEFLREDLVAVVGADKCQIG